MRPPYSSDIPVWPTDDEVKHFHIDYEVPDFKERKGFEQNLIWESVKVDWLTSGISLHHR